MTRDEILNQIDAAYDCDRPELAAELEEKLKGMHYQPAAAQSTEPDPYADYRDADGTINTAKIFGVA